jgi:hypothetical protein
MRTAIQIVLTIAILILAFLLFESIMQPIRFNRERDIRRNATIQRLKDIRTAEIAYKAKFGNYTGDFNALIDFVKHDSFPNVMKIGSIPDSLYEAGMTENEALKLGIIIRDTINVSVLDSIFYPGYPIDSLRFVPFTDTNQFFLGATEIETGSMVRVKVFEASVLYDILLHGLDKQLIINYNANQMKITNFRGLRVGSLEEPTNNAGNWE